MGVIVSIPVLFASYLFAKYIGKQVTISDEEADTVINQSYEELLKKYGTLPSGTLSLAPIFVPIVLMALGSISKIMGLAGGLGNVMNFLGNPIIALAIGVIFSIFLLVNTKKLSEFDALTNDTLKLVGPILFITAAGGVLGKVITEAGFVEYIKQNAHVISTAGIFFPFLISAVLKTAQGSSTVAIITTASIMGMFSASDSLMNALGLASEIAAALTVMAIAAGSMCVSHANDSYYWVVTNFTKMTPQQGYRTQTTLTFIMGIVGILTVYVLSLLLL